VSPRCAATITAGSSWLARCCVTNAAVAERDGEQIVNMGDCSTSGVVKA